MVGTHFLFFKGARAMMLNQAGWIRRIAAIGLVALFCATARASDESASTTAEGGAVARDDFERDAPTGWSFTDPNAWRIAKEGEGGNRVLELFQQSEYKPPVRSPLNIALLNETDLGAFVLDVKVRSTTRDYGHRDLCLFFGHQDPSHFYYVHLAKAADPHAHSVFLVNGEDRVSIAESRTEGVDWTDGWHHVRLVRDPESGLVEVYFDDMTKPVITARDKTFSQGQIGLGSFDDTGMFDDLIIKTPAPDKSQ